MTKQRVKLQSVQNLSNYLKEDNLLPVYFFCGEDSYGIEQAVKQTVNVLDPLVESDFDRETITADKKIESQQILDLALSFPFGGGKKVIIFKNFDNVGDKKNFQPYFENPPDFTILIITQQGKVSSVTSQPYKTLYEKNYIFEARQMKSDELIEWLIKSAEEKKIKLTYENAVALIEIAGENKSLLETQIQKFFDNVGENGEITFELIRDLTSSTKKYTVFNLQDEIGRGNKRKALEIAYNLLDSGTEMGAIISLLNRFVTVNAQAVELRNKRIPANEVARTANVNPYYYKNCTTGNIFKDRKRLFNAAKALFKADYSVKTSAADPKTIVTVLISEMTAN